jgi:hypothetical protein
MKGHTTSHNSQSSQNNDHLPIYNDVSGRPKLEKRNRNRVPDRSLPRMTFAKISSLSAFHFSRTEGDPPQLFQGDPPQLFYGAQNVGIGT